MRVSINTTTRVGEFPVPKFDAKLAGIYALQILQKSAPQLLEACRTDSVRTDALTAAFALGLRYIFKEVYEIEYPELRAAEFIPLNTEVPAGELTFAYRMWNKTGAARIIHNFAEDLPIADVNGSEFPSPIITLGVAYQFSIVDIQRAGLTGVPLESMKADSARWAMEYLMEQIAAVGSANDGVPGLTNAPGLTATAQVSTGGTWLAQIAAIGAATAAAPASAVAAAQGIISDINKMKSAVRVATKGIHTINTILLPTSLYAALEAAPRSPAFTDDNLLDYIKKLCHVEVELWPQLDTLGGSGLGRVMAYERNPRVLRLIQAQPFTQLAPQPENLAWQVPCLAQVGGVNVIRPQAVTYMDGLAG